MPPPASCLQADAQKTSYSIIIPARNEAAHIAQCLNSIIESNTANIKYEIILINDFSTDETALIAQEILSKAQLGHVLNLADHLTAEDRVNSFKKFALNLAIGQSKADYIITTDADCIAGVDWLKNITDFIACQQPAFLAAPVSLIPQGQCDTLYRLQSIDFLTMQAITAASRYLGLGPLCNGANLAFSRMAFDAVDGYNGIDEIASGDDMLLMDKIVRRYPDGVFYLKAPSAIIKTYAQDTWPAFLHQRIRWSSKSGHYENRKLQASLLLVYLLNTSMLVNIVLGIVFWHSWGIWTLGMLLIKILAELIVVYPAAAFFDKKNEIIFFPLLQLLHIPYIVIAGLLGMVGSYEWKGRTVK